MVKAYYKRTVKVNGIEISVETTNISDGEMREIDNAMDQALKRMDEAFSLVGKIMKKVFG